MSVGTPTTAAARQPMNDGNAGTHVPLGEWFPVMGARDNISFPNPLPPVTVFWGVSKK